MEVAADHAVVRVAALAVRRAAAVRVVDLAAALAAGDVAVAVVEDVAVNQVSAGVRAVFSAISSCGLGIARHCRECRRFNMKKRASCRSFINFVTVHIKDVEK